MENKVTTPVVKGVIISLVLIVYGLILMLTGQMMNKALGYVQYIIFVAGIIISCTTYAKQLSADVTFGNVFSHGFKTTAVVIVIMIVYMILSFKVLFPDSVTTILQSAREEMQKGGKMGDADIDKAMEFTTKNFVTFAVAGALFMFGIVGAISALIGAALAKKNPANPFQQQPV